MFATNEISSTSFSFNVEILPIPIDGLQATSSSPTLIGDTTYFSATVSAGGDITYEWDFGDTYTGTGQYVEHTYQVTDVYTVTVTASNRTNHQSDTLQVAINPYYLYLPAILK